MTGQSKKEKGRANRQAGVSLIIVFFIAIIILGVVVSLSALLYSQTKIIRNISNSIVAFYASESGIEKVLFYDRQVLDIPTVDPCTTDEDCGTGQVCDMENNVCVNRLGRGLCYMTTSCQDGLPGRDPSIFCKTISNTPGSVGGCDINDCDDCKITFSTTFGGKNYDVEAETNSSYYSDIKSEGEYNGVKRRIGVTQLTQE